MSETIKTPSFELAVVKEGNEDAEKLMLCLPGRLDTKDYAHMRGHVAHFAKQGYLAVSFDPPGTWESPGDISLYTTTNYKQAVDELIEYFGNRPTVLLGHSRGGSLAMLAGCDNEHVTHIIAVMSHTGPSGLKEEDIQRGYYRSKRDTPEGYAEPEKVFKLPLAYFEDGKQHDILTPLKCSSKPKLFFYGAQDVLVTPEEVKEIYEAAAPPKELRELQCGHDYRRHPEKIEEVNTVVEEFLGMYV